MFSEFTITTNVLIFKHILELLCNAVEVQATYLP